MKGLPDQYDPHVVEEEIETHWQREDAYERTKEVHRDDPAYYFLDGPPFTTGQIHLGTALNKVLKDAFMRYQRMQGHHVVDTPGYDTHGLPNEVKVEQNLGFDGKKQIEEFGVDNFIEECKAFVSENEATMSEDFEDLGVWMDWDDPYLTSDPSYISSVWWGFKEIFENGLVYRGKRIINQCSRCETAIADSEVEYDERTSPSVYVKFPLVDEDGSLVVWTTTPWTIPANVYVGVSDDLEYSEVRARRDGDAEVLYVASECVEDVLEHGGYQDHETLATYDGEELAGMRYEHPLADRVPEQDELAENRGVHTVYVTDFVTADRTGLVHAATGHGFDDYQFGMDEGLPLFSPVAIDGTFTADAGAYEGTDVFDANEVIVADLDAAGALLGEGETEHRYGYCWRCDTPIVQNATSQWFIEVTAMKDRLLDELDRSEWKPNWARDRRQRDWAENARDWCVSRQRFWGIPMPIWVPEDETEVGADDVIVVGSRRELVERVDQDVDVESMDFHRPDVDPLTITEDGTTYRRVEDVFDVWFDSSMAAWAMLGYPEDSDAYESLRPVELIVESHDQTRGWFWGQLCSGVAIFDEIPYRRVLMHGYVFDDEGREMSKSLGNIVRPKEVISEYGRDPLRVFLLSNCAPGADASFVESEVELGYRNLNVVWNSVRFLLSYARKDDVTVADVDLEAADLTRLDRWILSRLQAVEETVTRHIDELRVDEAQSALFDFLLEDLSRYYIQSVRERIWQPEETPAKDAAYSTLLTVFDEAVSLLTPFVPYLSERLYQAVDGEAPSVHMLQWPEADHSLRDESLEREVEAVRRVESAVQDVRNSVGRGLRWPVESVTVQTDDETLVEALEAFEEHFLDRVNAHEVVVTESEPDVVSYVAEPRMDRLGPAFGEQADAIAERVRGVDRDDFDSDVELGEESYRLDDDMVTFERRTADDVAAGDFDGGTVYLHLAIDERIEAEGYAAEVVRRIQEMRRRLDLDVDAEIEVGVDVDDARVATLLDRRRDYIASETRAVEIRDSVDGGDGLREEWTVEDVDVTLRVEEV